MFGDGRHIVRGGSWNNNSRNARCAYRNRNVPDNFNNNVGFRLLSHDAESSPVNLVFHLKRDGAKNQSQRCPFPAETCLV